MRLSDVLWGLAPKPTPGVATAQLDCEFEVMTGRIRSNNCEDPTSLTHVSSNIKFWRRILWMSLKLVWLWRLVGWEDESTKCITPSNDCLNHACLNGATCVDGVQTYTCLCLPGYTGKHDTSSSSSSSSWSCCRCFWLLSNPPPYITQSQTADRLYTFPAVVKSYTDVAVAIWMRQWLILMQFAFNYLIFQFFCFLCRC